MGLKTQNSPEASAFFVMDKNGNPDTNYRLLMSSTGSMKEHLKKQSPEAVLLTGDMLWHQSYLYML